MGCIGFPEVLDELAHPFSCKTIKRGHFEGLGVCNGEEAKEPTPPHPILVQRALREPPAGSIAKRIVILRGGIPHSFIDSRPLGEWKVQSRFWSAHCILLS